MYTCINNSGNIISDEYWKNVILPTYAYKYIIILYDLGYELLTDTVRVDARLEARTVSSDQIGMFLCT